MPDPVRILAEIKAKGGEIETVEGDIVAGDAADINVVSMKGKHYIGERGGLFGKITHFSTPKAATIL